jgi:hypothetical protein
MLDLNLYRAWVAILNATDPTNVKASLRYASILNGGMG